MKKQFYLFKWLLLITNFSTWTVVAQAPSISYTGVAASYPTGTAITTLTPTNTGGAVTGNYTAVSTFAGSGLTDYADGTGTAARFNGPTSLVIDASGNVYVSDQSNQRIRKITPAGVVSTFAGSGTGGFANGTGTAAQFDIPVDLAVDASGTMYVADSNNHCIRKITPAGVVSTFAGNIQGSIDGTGTSARFNYPNGVAVDGSGNVYVADLFNHRIRKITPAGVVSTFAGNTQGYADGTGTSARFNRPSSLVIDASGNVYVADTGNHRIRKITPAGVVSTFAGSTFGYVDGTGAAAKFNTPVGLAVDASGNIYVADFYNHSIRKITPDGVVTTLAGSTTGYADGTGTAAQFNNPTGVVVDVSGNMYVADYNNHRIRKIVNAEGYSISPALPAGLSFNTTTGVISGTPTAVSPTTTYTIKAANATGLSETTIAFATLMAQNTFQIASGTKVVTSGAVAINYNGGTLTNNGTITNFDGTLAFSSPVTFAGSGTTQTKDLKISHTGDSQLNNRILVSGSLAITNGNLNANNNLTLLSTATGNAVIAPVPSGSNITGKVTVQRYIKQGKRAFRFLTPSVNTDDFISNNWQLSTHITGSTTGTNGFDATGTGNPSMYTYNNSQATGSGWSAIANTNATNLNAKQGYRILIRGDRNVNINAASLSNMNNPVTLSATGTVVTGNVVINSSSIPEINNTTNTTTNGYSLVGNPYVNTIDWNTLTKSGLTDAYYTWDANMGTAAQRGRYVVFSSSTGTSNMASAVNQYIQPGQAFFVKNTTLGTAGTITFTESNKVGTNVNSTFFRTSESALARLDLQVYDTSELALGSYPIDAAVAVFDNQFTNGIEIGDVTKLSTGIENISFLNSTTNLAIDARPQVAVTDELLVQLQQFQASKSYTFRTQFNNFDTSITPFLADTYLNQYTALANNASTDVVVSTNADAASYDINRFKIVFQNSTLSNPAFFEDYITLYPNPVTNGQFNIALPASLTGNVTVKVINLIGQTVHESTTPAQNNITITIGKNLPQAVYIVQIENQGKIISKKITVD